MHMESLYCDEVGLMSPFTTLDQQHNPHNKQPGGVVESSFYTSKEDREQALSICLQKECTYLPDPGYVDYLKTQNLIIPRFVALQWLIKSQRRLNLSFETVFNAANYLDRFISMNKCHGWKYWMYELLSVACLSVASKFGETDSLPLQELQMEDLDHSFQSSMIQRMELSVLKALGWRLNSTTAYSYIELLTCNIDSLKPFLLEELTTRVTELLLGTLLDFKFLEFRPCVVAISALQCIFDELLPSTSDAHMASVSRLIPQEQKDDLMKCHELMEKRLVDPLYNLIACGCSYYCPSSLVTVLSMGPVEIYDCQTDLSRINVKPSMKKRKREEQ